MNDLIEGENRILLEISRSLPHTRGGHEVAIKNVSSNRPVG